MPPKKKTESQSANTLKIKIGESTAKKVTTKPEQSSDQKSEKNVQPTSEKKVVTKPAQKADASSEKEAINERMTRSANKTEQTPAKNESKRARESDNESENPKKKAEKVSTSKDGSTISLKSSKNKEAARFAVVIPVQKASGKKGAWVYKRFSLPLAQDITAKYPWVLRRVLEKTAHNKDSEGSDAEENLEITTYDHDTVHLIKSGIVTFDIETDKEIEEREYRSQGFADIPNNQPVIFRVSSASARSFEGHAVLTAEIRDAMIIVDFIEWNTEAKGHAGKVNMVVEIEDDVTSQVWERHHKEEKPLATKDGVLVEAERVSSENVKKGSASASESEKEEGEVTDDEIPPDKKAPTTKKGKAGQKQKDESDESDSEYEDSKEKKKKKSKAAKQDNKKTPKKPKDESSDEDDEDSEKKKQAPKKKTNPLPRKRGTAQKVKSAKKKPQY